MAISYNSPPGGNTGSVWAINAATGDITVNAALDYETTESYTLVVKGTDKNGVTASDTKTASVAVIITITSENEADPTFGPTAYAVTKAEDTAVGSAITTVAGAWYQ